MANELHQTEHIETSEGLILIACVGMSDADYRSICDEMHKRAGYGILRVDSMEVLENNSFGKPEVILVPEDLEIDRIPNWDMQIITVSNDVKFNGNSLSISKEEIPNNKFHQTFDNEIINAHNTDKKDLFLINDKYLIPYLNLIKDYKHIYKLIHDKPQLFNNQLAFQKLYENLFSVILDKYGVVKEEKEYIFTYFSFGIVAIIQKWIEKDCVDDIEMIASIMKKVIRYEN